MCFSSSDDPKNADLFEDSTHKYVLYNGKKNFKDINGCIVGIFVIIVQIALYAVCVSQVADDLDSDKFLIPVKVRFGKPCKYNEKTDVHPKLVCPPDLPNLRYVALAAIMLSLFLMKDIVGPLRGFKQIGGCWSKIWCIILFAETTFAALVAIMFAVGASEPYAAISNCIGVLFIHDLDEKAFQAFKMIQDGNTKTEDTDKTQEPEGCCRCLGRFAKTSFLFFVIFGILAFSLIAAAAIRERQRTQIKDTYGKGYYENQFSDGYYDAYDSNYYEWDGSYNANYNANDNDGIANIDTTTTTTSPGGLLATTTPYPGGLLATTTPSGGLLATTTPSP